MNLPHILAAAESRLQQLQLDAEVLWNSPPLFFFSFKRVFISHAQTTFQSGLSLDFDWGYGDTVTRFFFFQPFFCRFPAALLGSLSCRLTQFQKSLRCHTDGLTFRSRKLCSTGLCLCLQGARILRREIRSKSLALRHLHSWGAYCQYAICF